MDGGIFEKVSNVFDIPGEADGFTRVTVTGTTRVHIENHRGIVGYSTEEIAINGKDAVVRIKGHSLSLIAMSKRELVASGHISSVEYMR